MSLGTIFAGRSKWLILPFTRREGFLVPAHPRHIFTAFIAFCSTDRWMDVRCTPRNFRRRPAHHLNVRTTLACMEVVSYFPCLESALTQRLMSVIPGAHVAQRRLTYDDARRRKWCHGPACSAIVDVIVQRRASTGKIF